MSINLLMVIYIGHDKLMDEPRLETRYRMANELCLCFSTFLYINFSGNIELPETEHEIGNYTCGFISFIMVLNFIVIIYTNFRHLRLVSRKYYRRIPCSWNKLKELRKDEKVRLNNAK